MLHRKLARTILITFPTLSPFLRTLSLSVSQYMYYITHCFTRNLEFHDQRQSNGAGESGDHAKGQARERTGQIGSLEAKAHEGGDPIYDAIREAKEERSGRMRSSLENKGQGGGDPVYDAIQEAKEAMKQKAQKEKTGERVNPMDQTDKGVLTIDKKDD